MTQNDENNWIFSHAAHEDPDEWIYEICETYDISSDEFDNLDDDLIWNFLTEQELRDYKEAKDHIAAVFNGNRIVAAGTGQVWDGSVRAGFIADNIDKAIREISGYDQGYIDFYQSSEDGELHMSFTHYDGTHDVAMRRVTEEGSDFLDDNEYNGDMSEQEMIETVWDDPELSESVDATW